VSDPSGKPPELVRELIRSGSTRHSYPVLIVAVGGFALASPGDAAAADGAERAVALGMAVAGAVGGLGLAAFVGRRPDLLRSEDYILRMRMLDLVADSDISGKAGERAIEQILAQPNRPKQIEGDS